MTAQPHPMDADSIETVRAWHAAVNAGDVDRLVALSSDDIEVGGPRGSGRGAQLLREWFGRAGIHLEPHRMFRRDNTVVVEQRVTWLVSQAGTPPEAQMVASVFVVQDAHVSSVMRHADLASALDAAALTSSNEVC